MSDDANNGKMPGGVTGKGFQPGQSGNPHGVPGWVKEARHAMRDGLYVLAQRHLRAVLSGEVPHDASDTEKTLYEGVTLEDRNAAARLVVEYSIPKPKQAVSLEGKGGEGIVVQVVTMKREETT